MKGKHGIEFCRSCPACRFTRSRKKNTFLYRLVRKIQKDCPECKASNEELGMVFQRSPFFEE